MTTIQQLEGKVEAKEKELQSIRTLTNKESRIRTDEEQVAWDESKKEIKGLNALLEDAKEEFQQKAKKADTEGEVIKKVTKKVDEIAPELKEIDDHLVKLRSTINMPLSEQNEVTMSPESVLRTAVTAASVVNNTDSFRITDIGQLAHRKIKLYDLFPKIPIGADSNGVATYTDWDKDTIVRAAAMIAEGAVFPESTAVWEEHNITIRKVGDTIPITEESLKDRSRFTAEVRSFVTTSVDLVVDQQLYGGDGLGNNMTGIFTSSLTYTPVASGIADATIYDLIVKTRTNIEQGFDSKYSANLAMMNRTDIDKMKLAKDANNNYIMPPFVDQNGNVVDGMLVIDSNVVTPNTMLVGDSRFAKIYEIEGLFVGTGLINDQYTKDLITLKARRRLAMLVRNADQGAWNKVTDITAALVLLAT